MKSCRRLNNQLAELMDQLALEQQSNTSLRQSLILMQETLTTTQTALAEAEARASAAEGQLSAYGSSLEDEQELSEEAQNQAAILNQQIAALRRQLAALQAALDAAETKDEEQQAVIADLGKRLNAALAQKVQELSRYRSEFFGRLREILSNRAGIEVVGDRFIFPSEILFESGSAAINATGRQELRKLAAALINISAEIPDDLEWVLRIDGHTDKQPIATSEFPSNWHLSAARALSVVTFLRTQGVSGKNLVAAGFGPYHPLDPGESAEAYQRNRRIELKLTQR